MDEYTKQQLEKTPITKLKEIAKKYGVKGYTGINKTNKDDFVSKIIEHIDLLKTIPTLTEKKIKDMDKKTLVQYATVLKIERISLLNKSQLQEQILNSIHKKPIVDDEEKKPSSKKEEKIPSTKAGLLEYLEKKGITNILSKNKTIQKLKEYALAERCDVEKDELCHDKDLICDIRNNACLKEDDLPKRNYKIEKRGDKKIGGEPDKIPKEKKGKEQKKEDEKKQPIVEVEEKKTDYSKLKLPELRKLLLSKGVTTKYRGFDNKKDLINYLEADSCSETRPCTDDKLCDLRNNICVEEEVLPRRDISKYENYAGTEKQIKNLLKLREPVEEIIIEKKEEVYLSEEDEKANLERQEEVYLSEKEEPLEEVYLSESDEKANLERQEEVYLSEEDEKANLERQEEVYLSEKEEPLEEVYLSESDEKEEPFNVQEYAKNILLSTKEDDEYIENVIDEIQESEDENLYSIKKSIYKSLGLIR